MDIDSPRPYSAVADGLLKALGVDPVALTKKCADRDFYPSLGLGRGLFFDKETFGADKLVVAAGKFSWRQLLQQTPLSPQAQNDIARVEEADIDYLPGLSSDEKKSRLSTMSYRDFLLNVVKADPAAVAFYQARTHGEWGVGIDAVSALDVWAFGFPGFQGPSILNPVQRRTWDIPRRVMPTAAPILSIFLTATPRSRGSWYAI